MNLAPDRIAMVVALIAGLTACGGNTSKSSLSGESAEDLAKVVYAQSEDDDGIGVNSFLWSASLQVLDFVPLSLADSIGGVILTEWYTNPELPTERFKIRVTILDTRLRSDALKLTLHKEVYNNELGWISAAVDPESETRIENAILAKARELKTATLDG